MFLQNVIVFNHNMSHIKHKLKSQFSKLTSAAIDSFCEDLCTLLWAKDALNGIATRYNYKHNDLTNFFSKTFILFKHTMSSIKHKFENSYQSSPRPLHLRTSAAIIEAVHHGCRSSTSIMDFHKPPTVHSFLSVTTPKLIMTLLIKFALCSVADN